MSNASYSQHAPQQQKGGKLRWIFIAILVYGWGDCPPPIINIGGSQAIVQVEQTVRTAS